jgi:cell division protease FtsH
MKSGQKVVAFWFLIMVAGFFVIHLYQTKSPEFARTFDNRSFEEALRAGEIVKDKLVINLDTGKFTGELTDEVKQKYGGKKFIFDGNPSEDTIRSLKEQGIVPNYERGDEGGFLSSFFANWLPLILIIGLFLFIMRQIQAGGGKAMSFGKSRAKLLTEHKNRVTFKEVAGVDEAKEELQEIVAFLKDPKKFTRLGGRIPKGVLLVGTPGTGKTLLARAVAGEAGVPFYTISGSDFVEMFVGVGASRVRDLFEQGKKNAPCLIFIDEIDAVGRHRGAGMGGGHDEREQTLNQLLVEMDGFESTEGVIIVAATNRPDVLDPALLRPGRFDRRVVVNKPDLKGREQILGVHIRKTPVGPDVDVAKIARGTPGFSGADLENLVNEAALIAARSDKKYLEMEDFEKAKDKVIMGSERKSMVLSEEDKKMTAYHEAGHTLVGIKLPGLDPIHKVTIIPRGMALGLTQTLPEKDQVSFSKKQAENWIAFAFGGRAAEELVYKDFTAGAANDIERATQLARRMVCEWGMSEKLGPLAYEKREGPVFLGLSYGQTSKDYSESKAEEIDAEVSRIISTGYKIALTILNENREALERITQALLQYETIDGAEVELLVNGMKPEEIEKVRTTKKETTANLQANKAGKPSGSNDPVGNSGPVTA